MRVLHVISSLAPEYGGTTQVISGLALAQAGSGHQVVVCSTDRGSPINSVLPSTFFQSIFPASVNLQVFPVLYTPLVISWAMAGWLKRNLSQFDIIHIHGLYRFPPTYAAWQARKQRVPYVIRPHGALDPYLFGKSSVGRIRFKRLYERWFDLPNLHAAGAIDYTTEAERERTTFLGLRAPSFVVPNGIEWVRYRELPARGAMRARWGLDEEPIVLFLGRLHSVKGLDLMIPAFDALRRRVPEAQLVIAGPENDNYGQKVRGWVRERGLEAAVHFVGALQGADVVQAYVDADVFALPSYTESFGMTVVEAMACALPVVISDQVSIHAEVTGADAGLATRCDTNEVAEAIGVLLRDPERCLSMGKAGRRLVQARYTWPGIVEALSHEYQNVIDRQRSVAEPDRLLPDIDNASK